MTKVYKVVRLREDGIYESLMSSKYSIHYPIGEWVYPKLGKLFVFDRPEHAENFRPKFPHYKVFLAEAQRAKDIPWVAGAFHSIAFEIFWTEYLVNVKFPPLGTMACDALRLEREL